MILLPTLGYCLCLLNLGINPNTILRLGKNIKNWENTGLFWTGKQPVFSCKIGKIKSLYLYLLNPKFALQLVSAAEQADLSFQIGNPENRFSRDVAHFMIIQT